MPMYWADYLADTGHLSTLQHGAYLLLIAHYWRHTCLPNDEQMLARVTRMSPSEWSENRDVLASLFGDGWTHSRIDAELAKSAEISSKRRDAALHKQIKSKAFAEQKSAQSQSQSHKENKDSRATALENEFEEFWKITPQRTTQNPKHPALKAYCKARKSGRSADFLLSAGKSWASEEAGKDPQYFPSVRNWLGECRYDSYVPPDPAKEAVINLDMAKRGYEWRDDKWIKMESQA
jgi:uncharacterized protein YdaU (DUF1376 family)